MLIITPLFLLMTGIQNDLWARFVTLPNQDRIWTLTLTNKMVHKPAEPGATLLSVFVCLSGGTSFNLTAPYALQDP